MIKRHRSVRHHVKWLTQYTDRVVAVEGPSIAKRHTDLYQRLFIVVGEDEAHHSKEENASEGYWVEIIFNTKEATIEAV